MSDLDNPSTESVPSAKTWWARIPLWAKIAAPAAVVVVIAAIVLSVTLPAALHPKHHIEATIGLISSTPNTISGNWDDCSGQGGYSDFERGAPTAIKDENGNTVGSIEARNLSESTLAALASELRPTGLGATPEEIISAVKKYQEVTCILYLSGDVDDADYYTLTFSHRGDFTYSRQKLESQNWYVEMSLEQ